MAYSDKPRIMIAKSLNDSWHHNPEGTWICHNSYFICGKGMSPTEAYNDWASKMLATTYIPRKGIWNLQSVMYWYNRGCPPYSSYLQHQGSLKRFIGYIPRTDELVLQG